MHKRLVFSTENRSNQLLTILNQLGIKRKLDSDELVALYQQKGIIKANRLTEKQLMEKVKNMTPEQLVARNQLIEGNIRLVFAIVKDYMEKEIAGIDREELIEVGLIRLVKAIDSYDISIGPKAFSTYIGKAIENEFIKLITAKNTQKRSAFNTISLSHNIGEKPSGDPIIIEEVIADPKTNNIETQIVNHIINSKKYLANQIKKQVTVEEWKILEQRYGLGQDKHFEVSTQKELALECGETISVFARKENKLLTKLRTPQNYQLLKDYVS